MFRSTTHLDNQSAMVARSPLANAVQCPSLNALMKTTRRENVIQLKLSGHRRHRVGSKRRHVLRVGWQMLGFRRRLSPVRTSRTQILKPEHIEPFPDNPRPFAGPTDFVFSPTAVKIDVSRRQHAVRRRILVADMILIG